MSQPQYVRHCGQISPMPWHDLEYEHQHFLDKLIGCRPQQGWYVEKTSPGLHVAGCLIRSSHSWLFLSDPWLSCSLQLSLSRCTAQCRLEGRRAHKHANTTLPAIVRFPDTWLMSCPPYAFHSLSHFERKKRKSARMPAHPHCVHGKSPPHRSGTDRLPLL